MRANFNRIMVKILWKKMNYIDKKHINQNNVIRIHLGIISLLMIIFFGEKNDKTFFYKNCGKITKHRCFK